MRTKRDVEEILIERGLPWPVASFVAGVDGALRHAARVEETLAAVAAVTEQQEEQLALLHLDLVGVGGVRGCSGEGTLRLPCFLPCGKGRKNASDGEAWLFAARDALLHLVVEVGGAIRPMLRAVEEQGPSAETGAPLPPALTWGSVVLRVDTLEGFGALAQAQALCRLVLWAQAWRERIVETPPPSRREPPAVDVLDLVAWRAAEEQGPWAELLLVLDERLRPY